MQYQVFYMMNAEYFANMVFDCKIIHTYTPKSCTTHEFRFTVKCLVRERFTYYYKCETMRQIPIKFSGINTQHIFNLIVVKGSRFEHMAIMYNQFDI